MENWRYFYRGVDQSELVAAGAYQQYHIAARPATANMEALYQLPWTTEEAENIYAQIYRTVDGAQVENLSAVPNHPGSYYLSRYISFAFLAAYNEGKDPADALLSYVPTINKEITRKRQEFGMEVYEDKNSKDED